VLREEVEQLGGYEENDVEDDDDDEREGDASGRLVLDVVVVVVERRTIGRRVGAQLLRTTPPRSIRFDRYVRRNFFELRSSFSTLGVT